MRRHPTTGDRAYYARRLGATGRAPSRLRNRLLPRAELLGDPLALSVLVFLNEFPTRAALGTAAIAREFGVRPTRIESILKTLDRRETARLPSQGTHYVFNPRLQPLPQKAYLQHWFREAAERSGRELEREDTLFNVSTLSLSRGGLERLKLELKALLEKYLAEESLPDQMVQACLGLFPLTRESRSEEAGG